MSGRLLWGFGSTRSRIYWTLRMVPNGLVWSDLVNAAGVAPRAADHALVELLKAGFIQHTAGKRSEYVAAGERTPPYELEALGRNLLWALQEYPGGITRTLLAQDNHLSEAEVYFGLQAALLAGKAVQCWLPNAEAADRAIGYKLLDDATASRLAGQVRVPAFQHKGLHADFALQADGQVSVRWGTALAVLPGPVVREFFAFMAEASLTAARGR